MQSKSGLVSCQEQGSSPLSSSLDAMPSNPPRYPFCIGHALRYSKAKLNQLALRVSYVDSIAAKNQQHNGHTDTFVSIHKTVILCKATSYCCSFSDDTRMSLHACVGRQCASKSAFNQPFFPYTARTTRSRYQLLVE